MRLHALYHVLGVASFVLYVLYRLSTVLKTLMEDATPYILSRAELESPSVAKIPKILHQVFLGWDDTVMPEHWKEPQRSCIDLHTDWEYKLWTNETAHNLLATEYPWFLDTWNSYKYPIQRADSIRYFILYHYGGIYADLDNGCNRNLTPLLSFSAWMPSTTTRLGLTQNVMGAQAGHSYFRLMIDSLDSYNYDWYILTYLTIMNSAGPHFVSMVHSTWLRLNDKPDVRILAPDEYAGHEWSFFTKAAGGTWHHWDTALFRWVGHHMIFFVTACLVSLIATSAGIWWLFWTMIQTWRSRRKFAHLEGGLHTSDGMLNSGKVD